jgi:hypothetical protein
LKPTCKISRGTKPYNYQNKYGCSQSDTIPDCPQNKYQCPKSGTITLYAIYIDISLIPCEVITKEITFHLL